MDAMTAVRFQCSPMQARALAIRPDTTRFGSTDTFPARMNIAQFVDRAVNVPTLLRTPKQYMADALASANLGQVITDEGRETGLALLQLRQSLQGMSNHVYSNTIIVPVNALPVQAAKLQRVINTALHNYSRTDAGAMYRVLPGPTQQWRDEYGSRLAQSLQDHWVNPAEMLPIEQHKALLQRARSASPTPLPLYLSTLRPQYAVRPVYNALCHFLADRAGDGAETDRPIEGGRLLELGRLTPGLDVVRYLAPEHSTSVPSSPLVNVTRFDDAAGLAEAEAIDDALEGNRTLQVVLMTPERLKQLRANSDFDDFLRSSAIAPGPIT